MDEQNGRKLLLIGGRRCSAPRVRTVVSTAAAVALFACWATPAAYACGSMKMVGGVRTNYVPGRDFVLARAVVRNAKKPSEFAVAERGIDEIEAAAWSGGVRLIEQCDLQRDDTPFVVDYFFSVALIRADGTSIASCTKELDWVGDGGYVRTPRCDILIPSSDPEMTVQLGVDADRDGNVTFGDELHYNVVMSGGAAIDYVDPLDPGLELVPGLVGTNIGVISEGLSAGDTRVRISDLLDADPQTADHDRVCGDDRPRPRLHAGRCNAGKRWSRAARIAHALGGAGPRIAEFPRADEDCSLLWSTRL